MSNLDLWNKVEKTDPKHTKAITGKSYQGTSPKPHYLIHKATETFGPVGIGWGFSIVDERIEDGAGGERMHIARVKVWYEWEGKRGEVEHIGGTQFSGTRSSGKPFTDEDAPKKSVTDALVKALSMIGFAGDIFMGRYDDSKYVDELKTEARRGEQQAAAPSMSYADQIQSANTLKAVDEVWERIKFLPDAEMPQAEFDRLYAIYQKRILALKPIPKTLGDHLDNLEREAATNPH
jgi:hypothetical protein